ncbi:MAG: site-2 protease family protein [Chroococcidiopsidaceae cyanobacterium CP_BM_ER_R8_30]|nr:site-2 protease family protein [Chroococcidiopsidaceae cyanobacterium CP_BM_ER_R8_30]
MTFWLIILVALSTYLMVQVLSRLIVQRSRRDSNLSMTQTPAQGPSPNPNIGATLTPATLRPITQSEETKLRNCFSWSIFYIHNIEYRPQAVVCRGQLRTTPTAAYQKIRENVEAEFGDRFLVSLQEGPSGKPFFALLPNPQAQTGVPSAKETSLTRPTLALLLLTFTLITTNAVGLDIAGVSRKSLELNSATLLQGLPYALALMTILGIHELGHYLTARFYKIRSTLPYFIPVPFFPGTFGAVIQMRSPMPNRKALFDVSIAGPLAGFVVTLPLLLWGLAHSTVVPLTSGSKTLEMNALLSSFDPNYSFLLALLSKLMLGSALTATKAIDFHPVALAGFLGLVATALNLMPVGQLDGGHIVHAMFGLRSSVVIGQIARLLLLGLSLVQPGIFLWVLILFFIPIIDQPALNDVSELDNKRDFGGLIALILLVTIILPTPNFMIQILQT